MTLERITQILRERYTGSLINGVAPHSGVYFAMSSQVEWSVMTTFDKAPAPLPYPLGDLLAINVIKDDSLEEGEWRLVDIQTKEVVEIGKLERPDNCECADKTVTCTHVIRLRLEVADVKPNYSDLMNHHLVGFDNDEIALATNLAEYDDESSYGL